MFMGFVITNVFVFLLVVDFILEFSRAGDGLVLPFGIRRYLAEGNSTAGNSTTLVLAAERTRRKDPLDHLNHYTGGFNISNKHYWAVSSFPSSFDFPFVSSAGFGYLSTDWSYLFLAM